MTWLRIWSKPWSSLYTLSHPMSSLRFAPITAEEARQVLNWRYHDLPTLYDPAPEELEDDIEVLLTPAYNYFAARSVEGLLVGFCCYGADAQVPGGDYSLRNAVDVGLGMNPILVGRGLSHAFLAAILEWGRRCFEPDHFRATVAAINVRSLGMFSRAGFYITQRFRPPDNDIHEFLIMVRAEQSPE
jgi:[ribosomal protein S18]-alanine N-acetyltransferase